MRRSQTLVLLLVVILLLGWRLHRPARLLAEEPVAQDALAPVLLAPEDGASTTGASDPPLGLPILFWAPVEGATRYNVQVSGSVGFAEPVVDVTTEGTAFTLEEALPDGVYYWRVRAQTDGVWGPFSEARSFTKDWSAEGVITPKLIAPVNGKEMASMGSDDFRWEPVPGAAAYLFELGTDASMNSVIYSKTTLQSRHTPDERLGNNLYYWRVTPIDNQGNFGHASAILSFNFNWSYPPQLLTPEDDASMAFLPRFSWTAVEAARSYEIQISTQPDFAGAASYTTENTEFIPEGALSNDQDYYWRVKAMDYEGTSSPWSQVRRFRVEWHFRPQLLTPADNATRRAYPFFSWTPVPGAQQYQIQIAESTSFDRPTADVKVYNATTYAHPEWRRVFLDQDFFWRVRGVDAKGNVTPWSSVYSFRFSDATTPNLVYPLPYYAPDAENLPVHGDRTVDAPLFVWDSALIYDWDTNGTEKPAFYRLSVSDDPAFGQVRFQVETRGLAAAPRTGEFTALQDGVLYFWKVQAFRRLPSGEVEPFGSEAVWTTRIDRGQQPAPTAAITPIQPADRFETVDIPPVLGWLPVQGAAAYAVEVSRDADFTDVVDSGSTPFLHFVPWQGRKEDMPAGAYWWRVQAQDAGGAPVGDWSAARVFFISQGVLTGNQYDLVPPLRPASILSATQTYSPSHTFVASSTLSGLGDYELGDLHVMLDRTYNGSLNWVIAFGTGSVSGGVRYGVYVDANHDPNKGGPQDPQGKPITTTALYRPDYVIYIDRQGDAVSPDQVTYYRWTGSYWSAQSLTAIGGDIWYDSERRVVQLLAPYTALGSGAEDFTGSIAVQVFSTEANTTDGVRDMVPPQVQSGVIQRPALLSDMLTPLFPFDAPLSNPYVFYDLPPLRWRMPYRGSIDGYQVEVARDPEFTDLVETWETFENKDSPFFMMLPTAFQSVNAYEDNESYYWRVRVRHEKYDDRSYDYGPWSPPMRFKLSSRRVGQPEAAVGGVAAGDGRVMTTPVLRWQRVEGAAGYLVEIDDDANFSSPIVSRKPDSTGYIHTDILADGTYYWRVAMRRSDKIAGQWTAPLTFTIQSVAPTPLSPINGEIIPGQPTFKWSAVLTPTGAPLLAAPRYRLQVDDDPNFSTPINFTTSATSYTLVKRESLADGAWYWRVAILDANNKVRTFSPVQQFYKEYLPPHLLEPLEGSTEETAPLFRWSAQDGAAYYQIQIDDDPLFNSPTVSVYTDNTSYTPTKRLKAAQHFWRVRFLDADRTAGPFEVGKLKVLGATTLYAPVVMR